MCYSHSTADRSLNMVSSKKDARANDVIEIGGHRYILDPRGDGRVDSPPHSREHVGIQNPTDADFLEGNIPAYSYQLWARNQERTQHRPASTIPPNCMNYPCPKTPLLGRKYCGNWCMNRATSKRRYRREHSGSDRWLDLVGGAAVHLSRPFPLSYNRAHNLFQNHIGLGVCQFRSDSDYCPSVQNPYADPSQPRCLVYAVYADDLMLWRARNRGRPARRRYTTEDGRWLETAYGRGQLGDPDDSDIAVGVIGSA